MIDAYCAKSKFNNKDVFFKIFRDFKSKPKEVRDVILRQIEKTRALMESDCFVHIIKYVIPNNNLYVVSQCTLMNLAEFILSQFTFFSAKKNSNLFSTKMLGVNPFDKIDVDLYDLHSSKS